MKLFLSLGLVLIAAAVALGSADVLPYGIYFNANSNIFRMMPDGTSEVIGDSSGFGVVRGMAFYKKRLFVLYSDELTEMVRMDYYYRDDTYDYAKTLTNIGSRDALGGEAMVTYEGNEKLAQLYKVTFPESTPNKPQKTRLGRFSLYPDVVVNNNHGRLICAEKGNFYSVDIETGDGEKVAGKGKITAGVVYHGFLFTIEETGNIAGRNLDTGAKLFNVTTCSRFMGSKGLTVYQGYLYAIGKNKKFWQINPETGDVKIIGNKSWSDPGPMASLEKDE